MPNLAQEQKESRPDTVLRLRTPSSDHFQEIRDPGIRAIDILSNRHRITNTQLKKMKNLFQTLLLQTPSSDHFQESGAPACTAIEILGNRLTPHRTMLGLKKSKNLVQNLFSASETPSSNHFQESGDSGNRAMKRRRGHNDIAAEILHKARYRILATATNIEIPLRI